MRLDVSVRCRDAQATIPQRTGGEGLCASAADLEVEAGIRFDKALVRRRPVEPDLACRVDLGRGDHRVEDEGQLVVEAVDDRARKHAVEGKSAYQQECCDP